MTNLLGMARNAMYRQIWWILMAGNLARRWDARMNSTLSTGLYARKGFMANIQC